MKTPSVGPRAVVPFDGAVSGAQRQAEQTLVEGSWLPVRSVAAESTARLGGIAGGGRNARAETFEDAAFV